MSACRRIFHAKTLTDNGAFKECTERIQAADRSYADTPIRRYADTPIRRYADTFLPPTCP